MKQLQWVRYSWDIKAFAPEERMLAPSFAIRRATVQDAVSVCAIVSSAFALDSDWNSMYGEVRPLIENALRETFFEKKEPFCLILTHGVRIIGASALSADPNAERHLLTGPCISSEYRNRGFGSALLAQSLLELKKAGVSTACGITRKGAAASQFVYSKFGSSCPEPLKDMVLAKEPLSRNSSTKLAGRM